MELKPNHQEAKLYLDKIDKEINTGNRVINDLLRQAYQLEKQGNYRLASVKYQEILKQEENGEYPKAHPLFTSVEGEVEHWEKSYWNLNKNK